MIDAPVIPDHTLLQSVGCGAYGEVWLARNVMGAPRAVKVIWRRQFESDRPYEREFAGIQRYEPVSSSSGGLVHVLHVGRHDAAGYFYYVMELADAATDDPAASHSRYSPRTLRSDLNRHGRLSTGDCLRLALDVLSGLALLHRHGLVHRDVKPANIIYVNNRAKLADIGLVAAGGEARTFVGTEGYIAPEGPGSTAADLYALGIVLFEASTGFSPERFPDVPAEWLADSASDDALEFHEVILKACEARRERRYGTAEQMHADLALLQSGQSLRRIRALERRYTRLRRVGAVGTTLLAVSLVAVVFANYRARVAAESRSREIALRHQAEAALFQSRLAEAAGSRRTGQAGQRFNALAAIRDAARLQPRSPELRDEAIAALATVDVREAWRQPLAARIYHLSAITDGAQRWMIDAIDDFTLRVREIGTWRTLGLFPPGPAMIDRVGPVSPDGEFVRVRYVSGDRWIWDVARCQPVLTNSAAGFTEGGSFVERAFISLAKDGEVLWQSLEGVSNRVLAHWHLPAGAAIANPSGNQLLIVDPRAESLCLSDLRGSAESATFRAPPGTRFTSVTYSHDGRWLAGAANDSRVYIWDARTNAPPVATLRGHHAEIVAIAFHPEGHLLATSSWDGTTRLWDWTGEQTLLRWGANCGQLGFSADGTRLLLNTSLSGKESALVALEIAWPTVCRTVHEPRPTWNPSGHKGPRDAAFSPDGRWLLTATWDGIRCYDACTMSVATRVGSPATRVSFAGEPLELFAANVTGGAWRQTFVSRLTQPELGEPTEFSGGAVRSLVPSRDARIIAVATGHGVELERPGGTRVKLPDQSVFEETAVSANGDWVASAPLTATPTAVHLWRTSDATLHHRLPAGRNPHLAFQPDGTRLAINHGDGLDIWNTETGKRVWRRPRLERYERAGGVAYSPDGRLIAACLSQWRLTLVAADTGNVVARLEAPHGSAPGRLAFSPDGQRLAVMLADHEWQLWDLHALREELDKLGLNWLE